MGKQKEKPEPERLSRNQIQLMGVLVNASGPLSAKEMVLALDLPASSVYAALKSLVAAKMARSTWDFSDDKPVRLYRPTDAGLSVYRKECEALALA